MSLKSPSCLGKQTGKPLSAYSSEPEASDAANYIKDRYGNDMTPYRCSKCRLWHLSPKSRQTPSECCAYCRDSRGNGKDLYYTEASAQRRADILHKERGIHLRIYECPHMTGWHLTSH